MNLSVDIDCPKCSRKFKTELRKLKPGNKLICPGCGVTINLEGDDVSQAAKALDQFESAIKKLGGRLK